MENKMKEVAKLLGVELGEKFSIKGMETKYKITLQGLYYYNPLVENWFQSSKTLDKLLLGYDEIIKLTKPILNEKEQKYLSNVIKPFRDQVISISKNVSLYGEFIDIEIDEAEDHGHIYLPYFKPKSMYKGVKVNRIYTLEQLDL